EGEILRAVSKRCTAVRRYSPYSNTRSSSSEHPSGDPSPLSLPCNKSIPSASLFQAVFPLLLLLSSFLKTLTSLSPHSLKAAVSPGLASGLLHSRRLVPIRCPVSSPIALAYHCTRL
ncbi:hypothetical protein ASPSYDRAFT_201188, partial [Aspergillus sydowii CBS 593.65]